MLDFIKNAEIKKKLGIVEKSLVSEINDASPSISKMAEYIFGGGGKRIRPAFLILIADKLGYKGKEDTGLAVAMEYIHTATLVHDDIIDGADTRRSKETLNSKYDSSLAILFGDYIYAKAIEIINGFSNHRLNTAFSTLTLNIIKGEIHESERKYYLNLTYDEYLDIIINKTGELFAGTAEVGAVLADADEAIVMKLREAGLKLGIAFQIIDDLFDYIADESTLGKPVLSDLREGKLTLPSMIIRDADEEGRKLIQKVLDEKGFKTISEKDLLTRFDSLDVRKKVQTDAEKYKQEALDILKDIFGESKSRELAKLSRYLIERNL